jgi:GAF domain-containing protein
MTDPRTLAGFDPQEAETVASPREDVTAREEADLQSSVTDLAGLLQARGQGGLEAMLVHIAQFAVRAIPGADGAGLTLLENDRPDTIVASAPFVRAVDDIQYGLGEGPCIMAAAQGRTVVSGSIGSDHAWPRFGPQVAALGVHSVISLPLLGPQGAVGALNVYAHARNAFDERAQHLGEWFAVPAAISVQNALALAQARRLAEQLQTALNSRATIDQAVGMIMTRDGCTAAEAFAQLRWRSQTSNRKLAKVAQAMLDDAVRRARARHRDPG